MLSFTRDDLAQTIIDKNAEFGVGIRGIIEDENSTGSEFANLQSTGVNMRSHSGVPNSLHHKYAIADANVAASNPCVITGSHNWSNNAENNSDENTLIIYDPTLANIYLQEFEERWAELNTTNGINNLIDINISVFPNPSKGKINILTDLEIKQIKLYNVDGKLILNTTSPNFTINNIGVYFIKIITDQGLLVKKIIID